jgi:hypothetical protein
MRIRTRITMFCIAGAIVCAGWSAPALAASSHTCGTSKESAATAYGGEGQEITQVPCAKPSPPTTPTVSSALPFTGLDLGLLIAAGAVLVAAGLVLRWRLRHGAE